MELAQGRDSAGVVLQGWKIKEESAPSWFETPSRFCSEQMAGAVVHRELWGSGKAPGLVKYKMYEVREGTLSVRSSVFCPRDVTDRDSSAPQGNWR